jgi:hypothetical protein
MHTGRRLTFVLTMLTALTQAGFIPAWGREGFLSREKSASKRDRDGLSNLLKRLGLPRDSEVIPAPNGNTGINGSGLPKPIEKGKRRPGRVIPAPNGNTGINGSGLPMPTQKRKPRSGRVIPAPNGNTGINGSGLPR